MKSVGTKLIAPLQCYFYQKQFHNSMKRIICNLNFECNLKVQCKIAFFCWKPVYGSALFCSDCKEDDTWSVQKTCGERNSTLLSAAKKIDFSSEQESEEIL